MKLTVAIDAPENLLRQAVAGIPRAWLKAPDSTSPVQVLAVALRDALRKHDQEAHAHEPH